MLLRREMWGRGLRYRLHVDGLPGNPDIVFPGRRVAVFVDGDFWHGRDWDGRKMKLRDGSNANYWIAKIERNRERDVQQTRKLEEAGWTVVRFWESDVIHDPRGAADEVEAALETR